MKIDYTKISKALNEVFELNEEFKYIVYGKDKVHSVHDNIDKAKRVANKTEDETGHIHHVFKASELKKAGNMTQYQTHEIHTPDWNAGKEKSHWIKDKHNTTIVH